MADFGTVVKYDSGQPRVRPATTVEWAKSAMMLNSTAPGHENRTFHDENNVVVYVDGGPDMLVTDDDLIDLAHESAACGDAAMKNKALAALDGEEIARTECVSIILGQRISEALKVTITLSGWQQPESVV